jgi:hypothetical protein
MGISGMLSWGRVPAGLGVGVSVLAGNGGSCAQSNLNGTDKVITTIAKRGFIRFVFRWSGRQDLNLRPVAAATALWELPELIAASSGFVVSLSCHGRRAGSKIFDVKQSPWNPVLRRFGFTSIMAPETIIEFFTGPDVTATCLPAPQNINIKHTESRAVVGGVEKSG